MDLFEGLMARAKALADAARQIIVAEQESKRVGIPGYAIWNGFDSDGRATVIKNNQTLRVFLNSNTCPPLGAKVYVDETFSVDYQVVYEKAKETVDGVKNPEAKQRPKINRKPILPGPIEDDEEVFGATWLVYHESLKELDWTTVADGAANPSLGDFNPLSSLTIGSIGLFVIGSLLFSDLEFHFRSYSFDMTDIPPPEDHPNVPEGTEPDEYNYFAIAAALLENLNWRNIYPTQSTDGVFIGTAPAIIANTIIFMGGSEGYTFSPKYFFRPWDSFRWSKLGGFLTHFGPGKVQWSLTRAVGVYPPKRFTIHLHAWRVPDEDLPEEYNSETVGEFPQQVYKQFVIPDDIEEWLQLRGNGTKSEENPELNQNEVIVYDVLPAHDFYDFEDETNPDLSKFVSYSTNYIHLNYVIKAYAPWTGIDDSLRINYYTLNLRAQFNVETSENPDIVIEYNLNPSTFNLPPEMTFEGEIYVEDENFPLQAGSGKFASEPITYRFIGRADSPIVPKKDDGTIDPIQFEIRRGASAYTGYLDANDVDRDSVLTWSVEFAPPGFVYNSTNGIYIFEPNVAEYGVLGLNESFDLAFSYSVKDSQGNTSESRDIVITIIGNPNVESVLPPSAPPNDPPSVPTELGEYDPGPERDWDPEPFVEDLSTNGAPQIFNGPIESLMLLPETDGNGNILGWQGRVAKIIIEEVSATLRLNNRLIENSPFSISDFGEFFVEENFDDNGRINGLLCTLDINNLNLDWLEAGDELQLSYYITARVNGAPFVGNFEDLSETQLRKIRSDFIRFAFDTDWRSRIYNNRTDNLIFNISSKVEEDSVTRDSNYDYFNIDLETGTISTDFVKEFYMHNLAGIRAEDLETPLDDQSIFFTQSLQYVFDEEAKELLFYWNGVVEILGYQVDFEGRLYLLTAVKHRLSPGDKIQISGISSIDPSALYTIQQVSEDEIVVQTSMPPSAEPVTITGFVRYVPEELLPTPAEQIAELVRTGSSVRIGDRWRSVLMPDGYERNGDFASRFDYDPELSKRSKGYLVFGFLGD